MASPAARRCATLSANINGSTNETPGILTTCELLSIYAVSSPGGNPQVNGVQAPHLASYGDLYVAGNAYIKGTITSGGSGTGTYGLADGTQLAPSLYFVTEPELGIWKPAVGTIGLTDGVNPIAEASASSFRVNNELGTLGGNNLSINPGGPNVDFNGKNLINVGAIILNPNYFQAISPVPVVTPNAAPVALINVVTTTDHAYTIRAEITGISIVDNTSVAGISILAVFKNIGGTVTALVPKLTTTISDAPLNGATATVIVSGATASVAVIGIAGVNIKWFAGGNVCRVPLV